MYDAKSHWNSDRRKRGILRAKEAPRPKNRFHLQRGELWQQRCDGEHQRRDRNKKTRSRKRGRPFYWKTRTNELLEHDRLQCGSMIGNFHTMIYYVQTLTSYISAPRTTHIQIPTSHECPRRYTHVTNPSSTSSQAHLNTPLDMYDIHINPIQTYFRPFPNNESIHDQVDISTF